MSTCTHDPEAVIQEADFEQAAMEAESARYAALRVKGVCTHNGSQGVPRGVGGRYDTLRASLAEKGVTGEKVICTAGCGRIFDTVEDWHDEHIALGR